LAHCEYHDEICHIDADENLDDGYCILHSDNPEKEQVAFEQALATHEKEYGHDYRYFVFPRESDFYGFIFETHADFTGADFRNDADFRGACFEKGVNFGKARFGGYALFPDAEFRGGTIFAEVAFLADAHFDEAVFEGKASFFKTAFEGSANFAEVWLKKETKFLLAVFSEKAEFSGAAFRGVDFLGAVFYRGAEFVGTVFENKTSFANSKFSYRTLFASSDVPVPKEYILLDANQDNKIFSEAEEVDFTNLIIEPLDALVIRDADLTKCRFLRTDLRKAEITNATWPKMPVYNDVSRESGASSLYLRVKRLYRGMGVRSAAYDDVASIPIGTKREYSHLERLYRELKQNCEDRKDYERASDFHYGEKEMRRQNPETKPLLKLVLWLY
jgi:uncharacterized protein YjbI with pentapeptide repeats